MEPAHLPCRGRSTDVDSTGTENRSGSFVVRSGWSQGGVALLPPSVGRRPRQGVESEGLIAQAQTIADGALGCVIRPVISTYRDGPVKDLLQSTGVPIVQEIVIENLIATATIEQVDPSQRVRLDIV